MTSGSAVKYFGSPYLAASAQSLHRPALAAAAHQATLGHDANFKRHLFPGQPPLPYISDVSGESETRRPFRVDHALFGLRLLLTKNAVEAAISHPQVGSHSLQQSTNSVPLSISAMTTTAQSRPTGRPCHMTKLSDMTWLPLPTSHTCNGVMLPSSIQHMRSFMLPVLSRLLSTKFLS